MAEQARSTPRISLDPRGPTAKKHCGAHAPSAGLPPVSALVAVEVVCRSPAPGVTSLRIRVTEQPTQLARRRGLGAPVLADPRDVTVPAFAAAGPSAQDQVAPRSVMPRPAPLRATPNAPSEAPGQLSVAQSAAAGTHSRAPPGPDQVDAPRARQLPTANRSTSPDQRPSPGESPNDPEPGHGDTRSCCQPTHRIRDRRLQRRVAGQRTR